MDEIAAAFTDAVLSLGENFGRIFFYAIWGVGVFITFSVVAWYRWRIWRRHHDRRSFRDFLEGSAFWIVAASAATATASVAIFPDASTGRGFLTALSLGAFFGAGIIMATDAHSQFHTNRR